MVFDGLSIKLSGNIVGSDCDVFLFSTRKNDLTVHSKREKSLVNINKNM